GEPAAPVEPAAPGEPATPAEPKTVKVGFLSALTGDAAAWGLPGLYGVEIWVDEVNAAGGLHVGGDTYLIEIESYDDEYNANKAALGAKKLVLEDEVAIVTMMSGGPVIAARDFFTEHKVMSTSLMITDIGPDWPYLFALSEISPLQGMPLYAYVGNSNPGATTVALTDPDDVGIRYHFAMSKAGWESVGIETIYAQMHDPGTIDYAPIATAMVASGADIMCWDAAWPFAVHLLTEQAQILGFDGPICGYTLDLYPELVERVGKEYIEGFVFVFPDFDDPALTPEQNAFYAEYDRLYPGTWSAVSWEYADNLKIWAKYAEQAGTFNSDEVIKAMRADPNPMGSFGPAQWVGKEVFGVDNALASVWPVVQMQDGKAVIVEMADVAGWYYDNIDLLIKHMESMDLMWYQR
ncbi:ABC transporter substrate-binding protein, partial [Chloroflexota bacterium]